MIPSVSRAIQRLGGVATSASVRRATAGSAMLRSKIGTPAAAACVSTSRLFSSSAAQAQQAHSSSSAAKPVGGRPRRWRQPLAWW